MLWQLTMAVCSILHGGCHAEILPVSPPDNALPFQMMMGPQFVMAQWKSEHGDDWMIAKWALTPMSRVAKNS